MNLAERMRPKTLEEVIGNTHIVSALKRQFDSGSLSQTILFTGDAGSGKTSFGKIIARYLNAEVIEIDCGSDGSIETIRELLESVSLSSLFSSHKVFILDEIHALSKQGQSALLKTLEDPQKNVHFILLTTEPQKILNTIKTRCVEYKTSSATTAEIGEAVRRVEKEFNVSFENRKDLWSLVEQANGSLRQVYAFLEKLIAVANENNVITSDMFYKVLGRPMDHIDENLPKAFLTKDTISSLSMVSNLRKDGGNPTGTLLGIYNYLKIVYIKDIKSMSDRNRDLMSFIAEKLSSKEITWDTIESIIWKYV